MRRTLSQADIRDALARMGRIAQSHGQHIRVVAVGGAVMVLKYHHRDSTKDVDAIFKEPQPTAPIRRWASQVAEACDLPPDWLNDGAKGYVGDAPAEGDELFSAAGITVVSALPEVLLATKLAAFRDEIDRSDAGRILRDLVGSKDDIWRRVEPHVQPTAARTKAWYAFEEIWDEIHGDS